MREREVRTICERVQLQAGDTRVMACRGPVGRPVCSKVMIRHSPTRRNAALVAQASKGTGGFDYQLGWPYIALVIEAVCVGVQARPPIAIAAVLLVLFQSPADNSFLKATADSGIFPRYKDAKFFCEMLTAWTFGSFLVVSYLMART